jgi:hypothetical protein
VNHGTIIIDEQEILRGLRSFERDCRWIDKHNEELKQIYPDEWVACYEEKIVEHDIILEALVERLRKKYPKEKKDIAVEFIATEEEEMII